ncbi:MAG: LemA family protein, partial [Phycisphaerales bacterium]|nr:LemA family protein [Phycisphaerales bacterium]
VGYAREREDIVDVEIARGGRKGTATEGAVARHFLISTRDESAVTSGQGMAGWIYALLGMLSLGAFFAVGAELVHARWQLPFPAALAIGVSGFLVLFGSVWSVMIYNELVDLRNRVIRAAANVDVQLKRRADLVRSLVAVVIGLRDHEAQLQRAVAFLRGQSLLESRELASGKAKAAAATVSAIVEGYPELKSSSVFIGLQQSLTSCEQRIALARDEFNGTAAGYNARIAVFPARIIARIAAMHPANFFQAESFARHAPRA